MIKTLAKSVCISLVFILVVGLGQPSSFAEANNNDSVFNKAYITSFTTGVVDVVDLKNNTVEKGKIEVGTRPNSAGINPNGTQVFVTNRSDNTVSIIDPSDDTVKDTIAVGDSPRGVAFTSDGSKAYVANRSGGTITVIDTNSLTVTGTISGLSNPFAMAQTGKYIYVTESGSDQVSILDTTKDELNSEKIAVGSSPTGLSVNPSGSKIYVANSISNSVSVIDISSNTVDGTINVGTAPEATEVSPDGSLVYVANRHSDSNSVSVIQTSDNTVVETISVGDAPYVLGVSSDGTRAFTVNYRDSNMSVIDTETNQVIETISLSKGPFMVGTFMAPVAVANNQEKQSDTVTDGTNIPLDNRVSNELEITFGVIEPPTSGGGSSEPIIEEITIPVETGDADSGSIVSETPISRTTDSNGRKTDNVTLSSDRMNETVQTIRDANQNTARIRIPDDNDDVSEVNINIPQESTKELRDNAINLEIFTDNVRITVPESSMADFDEDLFFRLTPIKDEPERQEVENRARVEEQVREISNDRSVNVVARPMTIETNMQSRAVNLVLPLRDVELPTDADEQEEFLRDLVIFIEHSDGDRELVRANVVDYKVDQLGLEFNVDKFSTFTILNMEGWEEHLNSNFHEAYIKGFEDGTFKPKNTVTRAEIATMIARNLGYDDSQSVSSTPFPDVEATHWAAGSIAFVEEQDLMNGNNAGGFYADAPITRAEIAAVVARYKELALPTETEIATAFPDIEGHWAIEEITAVQSENIVNGYEDGTFRPNENLTRAEVVKVMNRMFERGPLYGVETPSFPDVLKTHWAYNEVEEAAQDHFFTVRPEGGENIVD